MANETKILWLSQPEEQITRQLYLLEFNLKRSFKKHVSDLRLASMAQFKAKDIFRSSFFLSSESATLCKKDIRKINEGIRLSPPSRGILQWKSGCSRRVSSLAQSMPLMKIR
jgi:hypothetical protein